MYTWNLPKKCTRFPCIISMPALTLLMYSTVCTVSKNMQYFKTHCWISLGNWHVHMKLGTGGAYTILHVQAGFIHVICLGISNKSVAVPRQDSIYLHHLWYKRPVSIQGVHLCIYHGWVNKSIMSEWISLWTLSKALREGSLSKPGRDARTLSRLPDTISVPTRSHRVVTSATAPLLLTWWEKG